MAMARFLSSSLSVEAITVNPNFLDNNVVAIKINSNNIFSKKLINRIYFIVPSSSLSLTSETRSAFHTGDLRC